MLVKGGKKAFPVGKSAYLKLNIVFRAELAAYSCDLVKIYPFIVNQSYFQLLTSDFSISQILSFFKTKSRFPLDVTARKLTFMPKRLTGDKSFYKIIR